MKTVLPAADGSKSNKTVLNPNWKDTWKFGVGASYQITEPMQLRFGLAYDQSPVRSSEYRMSTLPDNDRIWFSLGAQWAPSKTSKLDFGATYIYIKDSKIDNDQTTGELLPRGVVTGEYEGNTWIFGAQYSMAF